MKRRRFIKTAGGLAAATGAGAFTILKYPRGAQAAGWGDWPVDKEEALLAEGLRAQSVLELHVNGGMSVFDSFYTIPSWGQNFANPTFYNLFSQDYSVGQALDAGGEPEATLEGRWTDCTTGLSIPNPGDLHVPFGADDGDGNAIQLGPWAYPFRNRTDVLDRMRIVVMAHDQAAHEGANPVSFTGSRLGLPRMAGVGTAIQRYFMENPELGGIRAAPYSYVLYPAGYKPFNAIAATTVGFHPGSSRPLVVQVDPNSELFNLLAREGIDNHDDFDQAVAYYRASYEQRMKSYGHSEAARSVERANYEFADFARRNAPELTEILREELFQSIPGPGQICGGNFNGDDMPRMQARMAAELITRPTDAARYVMWIDAGIEPTTTGGHDTHGSSVEFNGGNLPHTFEALLEQINEPGENDPAKIDLDTTMVLINSEFGRSPTVQNGTGTNHWPTGYVNIFIGGPVGANGGAPGRSVYGYMRESDGQAVEYTTPAENRMMIMQAMGIYPFSSQSFAVADVPGSADELEAALKIRDEYLGADQ